MKYLFVALFLVGCSKCDFERERTGTDLSLMPVGSRLETLTDGTKYWAINACMYERAYKK